MEAFGYVLILLAAAMITFIVGVLLGYFFIVIHNKIKNKK